jgi:C4-dicarboxylate transporter DctM subunit
MTNIEKIPFLERLENRLVKITRPLAFIGVLGMLIVACITVFDVLSRWLANRGVTGLTEVVAMVFAVAVAACIPSGVARRVNLRIDILRHWITGRLEAWMNVVGAGLLCLFFSLLMWRIFIYAASLADQGRTTTILLWPMAPFMYAVAVLLGAASIIQAVVFMNTLRRALALGWKAPDATPRPPLPVRAFLITLIIIVLSLFIFCITNFPTLSQWVVTNTALAVIVAFLFMWALLLGMIPLAAILGLIGLVGTAAILGFEPALSVLGTEATGFLTNSQVAVLPLFLMMGSFASVAGLAEDIYRLAHVILGRFRGGLAMATVGACAGFGAVTGSSLA